MRLDVATTDVGRAPTAQPSPEGMRGQRARTVLGRGDFGDTRRPVARVGHIFRWDLDKTYLRTEFDTLRDLVRTARLSAEERENIPGSAALLRALRDDVGRERRDQVFFISGSPEQLRTVIERKFALDGFVPDGFVLKPAVSELLRGRFRAVRSQVGYKLEQLLRGRAEAPVGAAETLFGDDAESDAFIYSLYADAIAGRIRGEALRRVLLAAGTYPEQADAIEAALSWVVREDPVQRIIIHLDQRTPPIAFAPFAARLVPIYNHLQTALVLFLDGTVAATCVASVAHELLARYGFDVQRLTNLAEDILRRRRAHLPGERLATLAASLRALQDSGASRPDWDPALATRTREVLHSVAERAERLAARPTVAERPLTVPSIDYLTLWAGDERRREEARRARKLAARIAREEERATAQEEPS
jgi:hypothetical protein